MTGMLQRIRHRRDERPEAPESHPAEAQSPDAPPTESQTTAEQSAVAPASAVQNAPAGTEPGQEATGPPSFRHRARMRRRLRYLRRVRELGFRDLGGLVFDQHRFARPNESLVNGKVEALKAVDAEIRALAVA